MTGSSQGELTPYERRVINFLLADEFPGARELRMQLGMTKAKRVDDYNDLVEFAIDRHAPAAPVISHMPVFATYSDDAEAARLKASAGGVLVEVQLFVDDDGYMSRLETIYMFPKQLFSRIPEIEEFKRQIKVKSEGHG